MSKSINLREEAKSARLNSSLSQCFLVDESTLQAIAEASRPSSKETPFVEIGPGTGHLTRYLLDLTSQLTVIEYDARFIPTLKALSKQLNVIQSDVMQVDLEPLLTTKPGAKGVVVGNLPYHLTGPILFKLLGELSEPCHATRESIEKAVIMVQKEVGERLIAQVGDSAYSQLSLQVQCWADVTPVMVVPKQHFQPIPKVDSMVLMLVPRTEPRVLPKDLKALEGLIKKSFLHRRKTLLNNLKLAAYPQSPQALEGLIIAAGLKPTCRPQEVSLEQYAKLSDDLAS